MPKSLRPKMIRLAHALPQGSSERKALLKLLAYGGTPAQNRQWGAESKAGYQVYEQLGDLETHLKKLIATMEGSLTTIPLFLA